MNCESVHDLLPLYLSGELTGEALTALQRHIDACEACSQALSEDRKLDVALRTAMQEDSPDVSVVLHQVHARMTVSRWKRMLNVLPVRAVGVVATIVTVILVGLLSLHVHQVQRTMALDAVNDHYSDLVLLRHSDWTYEPQDVARFMQEQFPRRQLLAAITPQGASFEKVRVCTFGGTHYAHFVFRKGMTETSVFIVANGKATQYQAAHLADAGHGLEVSGFSSSDLTGMVVGKQGLVPTQEIANHLAGVL